MYIFNVTLMPDYSCVNNEGLVFKCEARDTCTDTYNTFIQQPYDSKYTQSGYFINWESLTSLHNWVGSLDLRCASPMQIGMLGSVFFIGLGLGTIALAHVGDMYGRIKPVRIGLLFHNDLSPNIYNLNWPSFYHQINIYLTYLFLFTLGFLSTIRLNLSFIYGSEVFKEKHASLMGSASLGIDSLTMVTANLYILILNYSIIIFTLNIYLVTFISISLYQQSQRQLNKYLFILIGCQVSGPLANFFGPSKTLTVSFVLAGAFGLQLNFIDEQNQLLIIICLLITKFGVSVAISLCYLITTAYFPILNASRVFSYLCAKAKFFAMLAPLGAEVKGSFPLVSMSLACFVSAATAFMLEKHSDNDGDLQMSYEVNDKDKQGNEELEK